MKSRLGIISALLLLTPQCFAAKCRTCRGKECQERIVKLRACTRFSSMLPFDTPATSILAKESLQYGCLKLEYSHGESNEVIEKCIMAENIVTFCDNIAKTLNYTACSVKAPVTKSKRDAFLVQPVSHDYSSLMDSIIDKDLSSDLNHRASWNNQFSNEETTLGKIGQTESLLFKENLSVDTGKLLSNLEPIPEINNPELASPDYGSRTALTDSDILLADDSVNQLVSRVPISLYNVPQQITNKDTTYHQTASTEEVSNRDFNTRSFLESSTAHTAYSKPGSNYEKTDSNEEMSSDTSDWVIPINRSAVTPDLDYESPLTGRATIESKPDPDIYDVTTNHQIDPSEGVSNADFNTRSAAEAIAHSYTDNTAYSKQDITYEETEPTEEVWSHSSDGDLTVRTNDSTPDLEYVSRSNDSPVTETATIESDPDSDIYDITTNHQIDSSEGVSNADFNTRSAPEATTHSYTDNTAYSRQDIIYEETEPTVEVWTHSSNGDLTVRTNGSTPDLEYVSRSNDSPVTEIAAIESDLNSDIYDVTTNHQIDFSEGVSNADFNTRSAPDSTTHSYTDNTTYSKQDIFYEKTEPTVEEWSHSNDGDLTVRTNGFTPDLEYVSRSNDSPVTEIATIESDPDSDIYDATTNHKIDSSEGVSNADFTTRSTPEDTTHSIYTDNTAYSEQDIGYEETEPTVEVWSDLSEGNITVRTSDVTPDLENVSMSYQSPVVEGTTIESEPESDVFDITTNHKLDHYKEVSNADFHTRSAAETTTPRHTDSTGYSKQDNIYEETESTVVWPDSTDQTSTVNTSAVTPDFDNVSMSNESPVTEGATIGGESDSDIYDVTTNHHYEEVSNADFNTRSARENTTHSYTDNIAYSKKQDRIYEETEPTVEVWSESGEGALIVNTSGFTPGLDIVSMSYESPVAEAKTVGSEPGSEIYDVTTNHQIDRYEEVPNADFSTESVPENNTYSHIDSTAYSKPNSIYEETQPTVGVWTVSSDRDSTITTSEVTTDLDYISMSNQSPVVKGATIESELDSDSYDVTTNHQIGRYEDMSNTDFNTRSFPENATRSYSDNIYEEIAPSEEVWSESASEILTISTSEINPDLDYIPMSNETPVVEGTRSENESDSGIYTGTTVYKLDSADELSSIELITKDLPENATGSNNDDTAEANSENIYEEVTTEYQSDYTEKVSNTELTTISYPENTTERVYEKTTHSERVGFESNDEGLTATGISGTTPNLHNSFPSEFDFYGDTTDYQSQSTKKEYNTDIITFSTVGQSTTESLFANDRTYSSSDNIYDEESSDNISATDLVGNAILTTVAEPNDEETTNQGNTAELTSISISVTDSMPDMDSDRTTIFVEYTVTSSEDSQSDSTTKLPSNSLDIEVTTSISSDSDTTTALPLDHTESASDSYSDSSSVGSSNLKHSVLALTISFIIYVTIL